MPSDPARFAVVEIDPDLYSPSPPVPFFAPVDGEHSGWVCRGCGACRVRVAGCVSSWHGVCGGELAGDGVVEPRSHQGKAGRGVGASLLGTHPGVPERAADGGGRGVVAGVAVFVVVGPCVDRCGAARRGQGDGGDDVAARGGQGQGDGGCCAGGGDLGGEFTGQGGDVSGGACGSTGRGGLGPAGVVTGVCVVVHRCRGRGSGGPCGRRGSAVGRIERVGGGLPVLGDG